MRTTEADGKPAALRLPILASNGHGTLPTLVIIAITL